MRPLLHLLSIVLVLPSVMLAAAFVILGRAIATQSLLSILDQLLADALRQNAFEPACRKD